MKALRVLAGLASAAAICALAAYPASKPPHSTETDATGKAVMLAVSDHPTERTNNTIVGLDRIDQKTNVVDRKYFYERTGMGVHVFVVDRGFNVKHNSFAGRAIPFYDHSRSPNSQDYSEETGGDDHGSVCAGLAASRELGVAKNALVYSVRVSDFSIPGSTATFLNGLEEILKHIDGRADGVRRLPAVVSISMGFVCRNSANQFVPGLPQNQHISDTARNDIENKIRALVTAGAVVVCGTNDVPGRSTDHFTPARIGPSTAGLITVAATNATDNDVTFDDSQYSGSSFGLIELHAPGGNSISLQRGPSPDATYDLGGFLNANSAAVPLVAGACALYLENSSDLPPSQQPTPAQVEAAVAGAATFTPAGTRMVYTGCDFLGKWETNPLFNVRRFVKQHYFDFLGRQPDDAGWNFWVNGVQSDPNCGASNDCVGRIGTSKAFFESLELRATTFFAYRVQRLTFNNFPRPGDSISHPALPRMERIYADARKLGRGLVVGAPGWEQVRDSNQLAFCRDWVSTGEFQANYPPGMDNLTMVQTMYTRAGVPMDDFAHQQVARLNQGVPRGDVLFDIVRSERLSSDNHAAQPDTVRNLWNPMYVLLCYYGYLRRNPDDPPDRFSEAGPYAGYEFWVNSMNHETFVNNNADSARFHMIKAFLLAIEYEQRFQKGPHCGQPGANGGDEGGGGGGAGLPPPPPPPGGSDQ